MAERNAMATLSADKNKRSFEFRMSKKVAELTQVVHMLFTRNHEKEVEIEALKEAYEFEISEILTDARNKISNLEKQLEDMLRQQAGESDRIRKLLEGDFQNKERDWNKRLEESERLLQEERTECQNLRDMLIRAQRDIENLRQGVSEQMSSQAGEVAKRDREIERLKKHIAALEQSVKDCGKESSDIIRDLERGNEKLERDLRHVHGMLDESHRTRDGLLMRNKQLEADMKTLKRDFNKKVAEVVANQKPQRNGPVHQDHNEELERLRREIQRYRLELSNRDLNFNRMFTEKQPIHVDRSGGPWGQGILKTSHSAGSHASSNNVAAIKREKTLSQLPPHNPIICFEEPAQSFVSKRHRTSLASSISDKDSRFPSICSTPEQRQRPSTNSRLVKPKPLPKEMLYTK